MKTAVASPTSSVTFGIALRDGEVGGLSSRAPDTPGPIRRVGKLRERLRRPLLMLFPAVLAVVASAYYVAQEPYVSTDDAFIRAAKDSVNSRVAGQVVEISVVDNQRVKQGQHLFQIDPEPYRIAVAQAEAHLDSARLQVDELKATYRQQLAELQSAIATVDFSMREYARKNALVTDGWTPRAVFDKAGTDLRIARQRVASDAEQVGNTVAALDGDPNIVTDRHPSVHAAQAELGRAQLNLSYATVVAPDDGIVTKVEDLQVGDFVNPGVAAFSIISSRDIWVEANFRERDLTHMQPGQEADIHVDAYPDRTIKAHIVSMSPGTGADFAVLPPENATGNWVKVVQRLPVRLELDKSDGSQPLFSGLSVTVRVDTGCRRSWRHPFQAVCVREVAE
jgi:membrane fusion protein (multidrug efflux system)